MGIFWRTLRDEWLWCSEKWDSNLLCGKVHNIFSLLSLSLSLYLSSFLAGLAFVFASLNIQQLKCSRLINFWSFSKAYALSAEIKCRIFTIFATWKSLLFGWHIVCICGPNSSQCDRPFQELHFEPFTRFAEHSLIWSCHIQIMSKLRHTLYHTYKLTHIFPFFQMFF